MSADKPTDAEQTEGGVKIIDEKDYAEMFSGSAAYVNRTTVSLNPDGVRMTFMEQHPTAGPHFRAAVFMGFPQAFALLDLLKRQMAKVEYVEVPDEATAPPENTKPGG